MLSAILTKSIAPEGASYDEHESGERRAARDEVVRGS